jgi:hypothetical protein
MSRSPTDFGSFPVRIEGDRVLIRDWSVLVAGIYALSWTRIDHQMTVLFATRTVRQERKIVLLADTGSRTIDLSKYSDEVFWQVWRELWQSAGLHVIQKAWSLLMTRGHVTIAGVPIDRHGV